MRVPKSYRSSILEANAWHSKTDAISSLIVFIGISGAMLGLPALDSVAAIGVAGIIAKVAWDLGEWEQMPCWMSTPMLTQ
jgi:divalent metal cation (Fe/Co/Zn/Cd) transporter